MTLRVLAALAAWATCVAATTVATGVAAGGMQDPPPKVEKFSHLQHVPELWLTTDQPEVWRDCRACHRFDAQHDVSAPQRECDACHIGNGQLQRTAAKGFENDLAGYRTRTRAAFRHHTHGMLECRACHLPVSRNNLKDFDVVTGPGQCAICHEQKPEVATVAMVKGLRWFRGAADADTAKALGIARFEPPPAGQEAAYGKRLVDVFAAPAEGINKAPPPLGGDFDHDDHAGLRCVECHAAIPAAAAKDIGTGQIAVTACGTCHQGAGGQPLAAATGTKPQPRELRTLGAFTHADHYRFVQQGQQPREPAAATAPALAKLRDANKGGCDACHVQKKAAVGLVQPDFPFERGYSKYTYLECQDCHAVPGWSTGESAAKPLHDSADGAIDGKNGWAACTACHVPGVATMKTERPTTDVERFANATFRFTTHTHPDITSKGIELAGRAAIGECATCHRAKVAELPTRLAERPFRHATHLPPNATAKDCTACHPTASTAASTGELAADFRTYSLQVCTTCHLGGPGTELVSGDGKPAPRRVPLFPHGPHVKAGASCTDCHEPARDGADIVTKPAAAACAVCHDHRPGGSGPIDPKAEGLLAGEALSCVRCHHEPGQPLAEAVPAPRPPTLAVEPRHRIETAVFAGFAQPQFHPLGTECKQCHAISQASDSRYAGIKRTRVDHVFAARTGKVHTDAKEPANCLACHWTSRNRMEAAVRGNDPLREFRIVPEAQATRARFGNLAPNFPGSGADG